MARNYTILGQRNPTANVLTTLYTVPSSNSAIISSITIANLNEDSASGGAFRISVNTSSAAVSNASYIAYGVNVPGRDAITLTLGVTLNAGSIVSVNANSSLLAFSAFGTEIY
jgi:hypothetical protein